ncbi:MAG TPA: hypothetical protein VGB57_00725, partial [Allosphingosinicella sp.]
MSRFARTLVAAVLIGCAALSIAAPAQAVFGIESFDMRSVDPLGRSLTQAGAHADVETDFRLETITDSYGVIPDETLKEMAVNLPPGLFGMPRNVPECTVAEFTNMFAGGCPEATQVGVSYVELPVAGSTTETHEQRSPVYNLAPQRGELAVLGFHVTFVPVRVVARLRTEGDYGIEMRATNLSRAANVFGQRITIWGVPADPAHNPERGIGGGETTNQPRTPFLALPATCSAPSLATAQGRSWESPDLWDEAVDSMERQIGCERQQFQPSISVRPTSTAPDGPTGLDVEIRSPQNQDPKGIGTPPFKDVVVTFPEGMSVNPSVADGLVACPDEQLNLRSRAPFSCPPASRLGTVEAESPALEEKLVGGLYARPQLSDDPASGEMFRIAMVLESPERGLSVRLPGQVRVDPAGGRVQTIFADNPQLPVEWIRLRLKDGPRSPLANPPRCGTYATEAKISSWGGQEVELRDQFEISCATRAFTPGFEAGTVDPRAGGFSPLVVRIDRADGEQYLAGVSVDMPGGLLAKLAGVGLCPEAVAGDGTPGSCPAASRVGSVTTSAGAGSPFSLRGGVYLTGPYKGAPYGLSVQVPAQAGPFNLGIVKVRQALHVNPITASVRAVSDPLPTIVKGVPVRIRGVQVEIDRSQFTFNPTGCESESIGARLTSAAGAIFNTSSPFRAVDCKDLGFEPKLSFRLKGETHRSAHPAVTATLKARKGDANIGKAVVTLPKTQFLAQEHIRTICTRVQWAAETCPKAAIYGYAKAWTPLLDKPLEGPVYLRSSSNELPDLVADLNGQIEIDLAGRIDSVRQRMRTTFWAVPDAPVSKFVLTMQGGRKGLLVNNTELCRAKPRARAEFTGHN